MEIRYDITHNGEPLGTVPERLFVNKEKETTESNFCSQSTRKSQMDKIRAENPFVLVELDALYKKKKNLKGLKNKKKRNLLNRQIKEMENALLEQYTCWKFA